jgi:translation initiation factor 1
MAVICNTCGLPDDLCACGELAKDSTKIIIRLETRRFRKKGTMIEGLDPKLNNLESVARDLKNKYACGGTAKEGYIFLQGDHRDTIKETLIGLGFSAETIELH